MHTVVEADPMATEIPYDPKHWTLNQAVSFTRKLEAALSPLGFHTGICGGVLQAGSSSHDLDVIVFPHTTGIVDMSLVPAALKSLGLTMIVNRAQVARMWAAKGSIDTKHVEAWKTAQGKRVDLFFLR